MPIVDYAIREVRFRIVVAGSVAAGKGTVIRRLHERMAPADRGEIFVRPIGADQFTGFDFTSPEIISTADHRARFEVITLSGHVTNPAHWKRLLNDADAVLYVADSLPSKADENRLLLSEIAGQQSFADMPIVFLYNKRDLPDAVSVAEMERMLNPIGAPAFETIATNGDGLAPVLAALCALALT